MSTNETQHFCTSAENGSSKSPSVETMLGSKCFGLELFADPSPGAVKILSPVPKYILTKLYMDSAEKIAADRKK